MPSPFLVSSPIEALEVVIDQRLLVRCMIDPVQPEDTRRTKAELRRPLPPPVLLWTAWRAEPRDSDAFDSRASTGRGPDLQAAVNDLLRKEATRRG